MRDKPGGTEVVEGHKISNVSVDVGDGKGVLEVDEMGVNVTVWVSLLIEV